MTWTMFLLLAALIVASAFYIGDHLNTIAAAIRDLKK